MSSARFDNEISGAVIASHNVVQETGPVDAAQFAADIMPRFQPIILRGQAAAWPAVVAGRRSDEALVSYLQAMDRGKPAEVLIGPPEIKGRFFYDDAISGCNFQKRFGPLSALLDKLLAMRSAEAPNALYAGAAGVDDHLAGWAADNPLPFEMPGAKPRVWIGNRTHVATHFDEASNVAVVVTGKRRFTLFPPEQLENLYVGPLHFTIAGPPVSMVDLDKPDLERYPKFAEANRHAITAHLEPGDALFIPPIWWHSVNATSAFNVMVNYWWGEPHAVSPLGALMHAILAMRDLPPAHRAAWQSWFEHFVFKDDASGAADHLPASVRGVVGPQSHVRNAQFARQVAKGLSPD
ncbi:cupin-like domain-containing protein [Sphingomonas sp. BAUL-RG-20F-R05-02]|uniref:cupin-like domain-containing protein n=1 Tax=Sphingomonas sp. BAUL-RG-20F-R05-02 TaxID=2914830 RepID=UPI0024129CBD|nr:cupin-like domain-containing protein [Sphingomonas sp. BAUL-RG-20F-R05-02]